MFGAERLNDCLVLVRLESLDDDLGECEWVRGVRVVEHAEVEDGRVCKWNEYLFDEHGRGWVPGGMVDVGWECDSGAFAGEEGGGRREEGGGRGSKRC